MSDLDGVNAQHMASMGLADTPMGQPYATTEAGPPKDNTGRCPATKDGFRCALQEGHPYDVHIRGHLRWDAEPEAGPKWCHDINQRNTSIFCERLDGHDGAHKAGAIHWHTGDSEPQPDSRQHCSKSVAHEPHAWGEVPDSPSWYCNGNGTQPTKQREGDQALPQPGQQCVQDLVIAEMEESKRVGVERYGSTLQTFNGRRSIQDVAEEVRDLHVYLTQVKAESETDRETLVGVVTERVLPKIGGLFQGSTGAAVSREFAEDAVDAIMGWVVGQRMDDEAAWGVRLVDAYYENRMIDFEGARVPEAVQQRIIHWETKK